MPPPFTTGSHFIVCGDGPLACRIAGKLTGRYGADVVVLLAGRLRNHGSQITALSGQTCTWPGAATAGRAGAVRAHAAPGELDGDAGLVLAVATAHRATPWHGSGTRCGACCG